MLAQNMVQRKHDQMGLLFPVAFLMWKVWRNCKLIKSETMTPIKQPYQSTEWLLTYRIPKEKKPSQATLETGTQEYGTNVASTEL